MYLYNIYLEQIVQHSNSSYLSGGLFLNQKSIDEYLLSKKFKAQKVEAYMKILL